MKRSSALAIAAAALFASSAAPPPASYSVLIHGGTIYDGSGAAPYVGDVALQGDKIVYVGPHAPGRAARTIDATGKAVSPGFVNMLSWANESLIADGRGLSDTMQGVTLEVMGEGNSMGPWTPRDEEARDPAAGGHQISDPLDHPRPVSRLYAAQGRHSEPRVVRRRDHRPRA